MIGTDLGEVFPDLGFLDSFWRAAHDLIQPSISMVTQSIATMMTVAVGQSITQT